MRAILIFAVTLIACSTIPDHERDYPTMPPRPPEGRLTPYERPYVEPPPRPEPRHFTLDELLDRVDESPAMAAARGEIARETGAVIQGDMIPNPVVRFEFEMMPVDDPGFGESKNKVILSQKIETAGKRGARVDLAIADRHVAEAKYFKNRADLREELSLDYVKAVFAKKKGEAMSRIVDLEDELLELARAQFEQGRLAEQDLIDYEVAVEESRVEQLGFETDYTMALRSIEGRIGLSSGTIKSLDETLPEWEPMSEEEAVRRILAYNPELIVLDREIERAEANLEWQKSRAWPDVTAGVGYARGDRSKGGRMVRDDFVMAFVQVPFPVVDRNQGNIRESESSVLIGHSQVESAATRIMNRARSLKRSVDLITGQLSRFNKNIIPKRLSIKSSREREFDRGKISKEVYLNAIREVERKVLRKLIHEEEYHNYTLMAFKLMALTG